MLAARLLGLGTFVFLAPGLACLARMPEGLEWSEAVVYGFAISYAWIFALSIVLPVMGWSVDHAALLTVVFIAFVTPWAKLPRLIADRARSTRPSVVGLVLTGVVIAFAVASWWIEPTMNGDAGLDLMSAARFADGGPIHFDNTSIIPGTRAAYIVQPYQLALGLIARWSGVAMIVAFEKFRPLLVLLSFTSLFALLRQLTRTRTHAMWAFVVVLVFVALDLTTWQDKSVYPVVQRGGLAEGVCVPVLITLILVALRRAEQSHETPRRLAMWLAPVFLVALMCTHAQEAYPSLFLTAAIGITVLMGADPDRDRKRVWQLGAAMALALGTYMTVHAWALPELTAAENVMKATTRAEFHRDHPTLRDEIAGVMTQESNDLLAHRLPVTTTAVIGVPALMAAAFIAPAAAATLALGIIVLAVLFAVPAGFVMLAMATSAESVQETTAYFALLGLLGLALGIAAVISGALGWTSRIHGRLWRAVIFVVAIVVLATAWPAAANAVAIPLIAFVRIHPRLGVAIACGITVVAIACAMSPRQLPIALHPSLAGGALAAVLLARPLVGLGLPAAERVSLVDGFKRSASVPSVLDGRSYYDTIATTISPRVLVPSAIIEDLTMKLPPRQVLVADPRYSCALAELLDAYCVNPEHIYGEYFLGASRYQTDYVHSIEGAAHKDWHPFFNDTWPIEDRERHFLRDYGVTYMFVDPVHADLIKRKLDSLQVASLREYSRDGYVLYRLELKQ